PDPGFIYRTTRNSWFDFAPAYIHTLVAGVIGERGIRFVSFHLWAVLISLAMLFFFIGSQRQVGTFVALAGFTIAALLRFTAIDSIYPWLWGAPVALVAIAFVLWLAPQTRLLPQLFFFGLSVAFALAGWEVTR